MANLEANLLTRSKIPASSGHPVHKGTPREAFIKDFLTEHLSERVGIGSGEVIDSNSQPDESRNQIDIVLYKREYPKLDFGGGINCFLIESVVATIEVKSVLTQVELEKAIRTARAIKSLQRNIVTSFRSGYQPPSILSFVVAYDGPANMETVYSWIGPIHRSLNIPDPSMGSSIKERIKIASPSVDGVFILGKGFIQFDNSPLGFITDEVRAKDPEIKWLIADTPSGSLLLLFMLLTQAVSGIAGSWLNPLPYLSGFKLNPNSVKGGP